MKLVFYSVVLNHHQAPVADEFYKLLGDEYCFVELLNLGDAKGSTIDYSGRSYLLRAWESEHNFAKAMDLARTAECCVFSGVQSLPYLKERMNKRLLSFDMGERWLKNGWKSLTSPRLLKWFSAYHLGGWRRKPLYKLCMSAFAAKDHYLLGTFQGKAYKWGYFTRIDTLNNELESFNPSNPIHNVRLMWCARFIDWKHPELPILLADRLKREGFEFTLDMYGDGVMRESLEQKTKELGLSTSVKFHGNVPNNQIHQAMREHDVFLFTSDRCEGWGTVANEAMGEGCLLIGSNEIGAVPYLVQDNVNGLFFNSNDLQSLYDKVTWVIEHPLECLSMRKAAIKLMQEVWSPRNAANSFLLLVEDLKNGTGTSITEGPCSKA